MVCSLADLGHVKNWQPVDSPGRCGRLLLLTPLVEIQGLLDADVHRSCYLKYGGHRGRCCVWTPMTLLSAPLPRPLGVRLEADGIVCMPRLTRYTGVTSRQQLVRQGRFDRGASGS